MIEIADITDDATVVASMAGAPVLIGDGKTLWHAETGVHLPLAAEIGSRVLGNLASQRSLQHDFRVFGEFLYRRCQEPLICIILRELRFLDLRIDDQAFIPHRILSSSPEIYFSIDDPDAAMACHGFLIAKLAAKTGLINETAYTVVAPDLLTTDAIELTMTLGLGRLARAFHHRFQMMPRRMIEDWLMLRYCSSLPAKQIDRPELAAALGRLGRSGLDLCANNPERYGPFDWLRRASLAVMLNLRFRPGAPADASETIGELLLEAGL